ncbi:DEAD/DEAH box helicase [Pseudarthrobacter sp. HLT3-5]|uniref:DEAD/DEAH box helicase n=1 Tax=Pseudarthrobacter cellobiosi TaxID=2953654 RepID=UPI00208FD424|nr:DEAD/DEAH box helicase [Pseudarthrobacter sp. HLT3-5]MCO4275713.1 DEAD/DEAH box helicase [Pseudarthrobacter sp. HLT3-5]
MPSQPDESAALAIQTPAINDRSLAAGLAYAMGSRVAGMSFDAATGLMLGKVRGGADVPYSTTAKLVRKSGGWSCTVGVCSCPVRKDCKHVAALLFAAEDNPAIRVQLLAPAEVSRLSRQPANLDLADWEQALSPLISQPGITQSISGIPLALQFEIEEPAPHFSYTGRRDPLRSVRQLKARPVIMGAKGKWIRGDVSWNTLSYLNFRRECNEAHIEWMQAFLAAHTAAANRVHNSSALWLGLNTFAGKNMWGLLVDAKKIGLALVHSRGTEPVRLAESPAAVGLNLSRYGSPSSDAGNPATATPEVAPGTVAPGTGADDGGLELAPTITVEGEDVDPASVGTIGRPAHGIFLTTGGEALPGVSAENVITLAPLESGLSEELLTFVTAGSTLHIPAKDETRFLTGFYPKLKQAARVTATDESVALPALALPTLSLLANYGADHRVRLHWEWHYKSGNLVTAQPLWRHPGDHGYRDDTAEARILEGIGQPWNVVPALGESATGGWGTPRLSASAELSGLDTLAFTEDVLPELRNAPDVSVDTAGDIADYREAEEAPVVSISTKATEQRDWFDLGIQISLEGQPVSFAAVFSALAAGQTKMLLPSGAYFSLDLPELHQLRALIEEARSLQDNKDAPLQISRFQAGLWDELAQLGIVDEQAAAWREAVGGLLEGGINGLPLPASLNAELRPYQLEGYNWLSFLYRHSLGGILADDMGLGKTVQALALMCAAKEQAAELAAAGTAPGSAAGAPAQVAASDVPASDGGTPFLVVAPTSVVGNWAAEAARFAPGLTVRIVSETFAKNGQDAAVELGGADIVITSYALFRIDYDSYASKTWAGLVLDEAQFVKNHQSKAYQCARKLPAAFKLAITGTPLENNLMEFWALTSIVAPGLFSSPKRFAEYYQKPVEKNGDKGQLDKLRRRVRPLMMRRTKDQVIKDLPPKQEQILEVVLNPRHQKVYQTHLQRERQKILGLIEDVNKNRFTIFQSLTLLRQLSLDASLVDPSLSGVRSSKLDVLFEQLEDLVAEGHRALIFSQFTGFLGKVRERLVEEKIEFCYLDGGTRNRTDVVNEFKNGSAPVFLISLKAGGFGLNLTEADYVFLLDPWWNPASEAQAVDRTHRIGQARNVMVYRLVAKDTIEEKVMALKARKSQLFADVMEGDALSSGSITAEDLAGLFKD